MHLKEDNWIAEYRRKGALWIHDGNPKRPHALLASGNHSNGFFNSKLVTSDDPLLTFAASDLIELFDESGGDVVAVDAVVGPQTGATKLANFLRDRIKFQASSSCFAASPYKHNDDGQKFMLFSPEELSLLPNQTVLLCEDVLTTGGSVDLAVAATIQAGGRPLPFILVLVNRSGLKEVNGRKIISLIDRPMPMWSPEECPLCQQGSEAIRPKGAEEWARLNADY